MFNFIRKNRRYILYLSLTILNFYALTIHENHQQSNKPTIYLITPTYDRYEQLADLTRLSQTLLLVKKLHWLIIEDSKFKTNKIQKFIINLIRKKAKFNSDIKIDHLYLETPSKYKILPNQPTWSKPKGVFQRNLALEFLKNNYLINNLDQDGLIYFMDDDNTYDIQLFEEMRDTIKVSIWPVALAGQLLIEKPILNNNDKVIGFNSVWKPERKYPIDMAGFAIKLSYYISKSSPKFKIDLPIGMQETYLLNQLIDNYCELEPKANKCSIVYVWHTQTVKFKLSKKIKQI